MALARGPAARARDVSEARRQIVELERKVGEQQVALDFFKGVLRRIEASRRRSDGRGATASSPKSRR
jgi:transposase